MEPFNYVQINDWYSMVLFLLSRNIRNLLLLRKEMSSGLFKNVSTFYLFVTPIYLIYLKAGFGIK